MGLESFFRCFGKNALVDQKAVSGMDGDFEIVVTDVKIEEAVFGSGEADELAAITTPFHATTERLDFRERSDSVLISM